MMRLRSSGLKLDQLAISINLRPQARHRVRSSVSSQMLRQGLSMVSGTYVSEDVMGWMGSDPFISSGVDKHSQQEDNLADLLGRPGNITRLPAQQASGKADHHIKGQYQTQ